MPRVLVVDDEPIISNTLALILRQEGYQAESAYDGEQAVTLAKEMLLLDVLVSDVVMPNLDGIEAALIVTTMHPDCKVFLLSGHPEVRVANPEARARAFELLTKPVHPQELLNRIRTVSLTPARTL
jgi:DNA-binding NtrC family response regulator